MTSKVVEPLSEQKRWRTRDVKYWGGTWDAVSSLIPRFKIDDFKADGDAPPNPYMKTVIRMPQTRVERPIPVGVVSNTYGLAQHDEFAERCFKGLRNAGVDPSQLRCEVGLTELGEWMNLRIYFPKEYDFVHSEKDRLGLRLECFNSVDGSSRLVILLGWLRFVCANGLVIGRTKTEFREVHDASIDLDGIRPLIGQAMKEVMGDQERMNVWTQSAVKTEQLIPWVDKPLAEEWGKKAACRVYNICKSGHDVEFEDAFAASKATEKPVRKTKKVLGSPAPAATLFDVSQALSWVATQRNNPDERLAWQTDIPRLVGKLVEMVKNH